MLTFKPRSSGPVNYGNCLVDIRTSYLTSSSVFYLLILEKDVTLEVPIHAKSEL